MNVVVIFYTLHIDKGQNDLRNLCTCKILSRFLEPYLLFYCIQSVIITQAVGSFVLLTAE